MSALSRSKYASLTFSLKIWSLERSVSVGSAFATLAMVMRTLASAVPPGPVAVMVYVAESPGVTLVEPSAETGPTSGAIATCVALVVDQVRVVESPLLMLVGSAWKVTVGRGASSVRSGVVLRVFRGFLAQPKFNTATDKAASRQLLYNFGETANIRISSSTWNPKPSGQESYHLHVNRKAITPKSYTRSSSTATVIFMFKVAGPLN